MISGLSSSAAVSDGLPAPRPTPSRSEKQAGGDLYASPERGAAAWKEDEAPFGGGNAESPTPGIARPRGSAVARPARRSARGAVFDTGPYQNRPPATRRAPAARLNITGAFMFPAAQGFLGVPRALPRVGLKARQAPRSAGPAREASRTPRVLRGALRVTPAA